MKPGQAGVFLRAVTLFFACRYPAVTLSKNQPMPLPRACRYPAFTMR